MIGVYAIVHVPTNVGYVGSANDLRRRFKEHKTCLRGGHHHSKHLQNAWNKYGEQSFEFRTLACAESAIQARELEQAFLDCFYKQTMNCKPSAVGFPSGDAHHAKRDDFHMKTVMQRLTPEERQAKYGKTKGTKRGGLPYVAGAAKRLSDPEFRAKLSESCKGKREVVQCPHCGLQGGGGNMRRYHFDKCGKKL
jgi:group I intron endonuclease